VRRALLGVSYNDVDSEMAAAFRLPVQEGIVVGDVQEGSPAEAARIRAEDIITRIDDTPVRTGGDLRRALRTRKPGDTVAVTLRRDGGTRTATVRLAAAPAPDSSPRFDR
jgi:serine protease Do